MPPPSPQSSFQPNPTTHAWFQHSQPSPHVSPPPDKNQNPPPFQTIWFRIALSRQQSLNLSGLHLFPSPTITESCQTNPPPSLSPPHTIGTQTHSKKKKRGGMSFDTKAQSILGEECRKQATRPLILHQRSPAHTTSVKCWRPARSRMKATQEISRVRGEEDKFDRLKKGARHFNFFLPLSLSLGGN